MRTLNNSDNLSNSECGVKLYCDNDQEVFRKSRQ